MIEALVYAEASIDPLPENEQLDVLHALLTAALVDVRATRRDGKTVRLDGTTVVGTTVVFEASGVR